MAERSVDPADVRAILEHGEQIEAYPEDWPYPSFLVLGWRGSRPLHVVAADNPADNETIVITVYQPDPQLWDAGFKKRKDHS